MKVFTFDLLPYGEHLSHLRVGSELPWPLPKQHFDPEVAARTYAEHLEAWELMDELGYDGIGFNEHHTSPYGLMNSPNIMAAAAAQRTSRLKLLIYGNLLPIHDPLRLAEELAMVDCLSERAAHLGLRSRHSPGAQRLQRGHAGVAPPIRGGMGDHQAGVDGGGLFV